MSNTKFHPEVGEIISIETANKWIGEHVSQPVALNSKQVIVNSIFFGKEAIKRVLETEGATGLRFYFAKHDNEPKLIIQAADENGNPIIIKTTDGNDGALDGGLPCPPYCP